MLHPNIFIYFKAIFNVIENNEGEVEMARFELKVYHIHKSRPKSK